MKFVKDNDAILYRTFCFPLSGFKSKYIIWKLEILRPVCIHMIVMHSLTEEHLSLVQEARLGSQAPGSETPILLVLPVAGLPAQVSMSPILVGVCAAGGQGPALTGLLFLWGGCDKEGDILASLRSCCLTGSE